MFINFKNVDCSFKNVHVYFTKSHRRGCITEDVGDVGGYGVFDMDGEEGSFVKV